MRIIGGAFKGRTLLSFKTEGIRPTSDNARESLFNVLGDVSGTEFLDLFAGTGAVGIEALSRGANVTFNDQSRESVDLIRANLKKTGAEHAGAEIVRSDAIAFIQTSRRKFDYIYIDPPYKSEKTGEVMDKVSEILSDCGTAILENEKPFVGTAKGLVLTDIRRYGRAVLSFFRKQKSGSAVYAGTFDPITIGHEHSIVQAVKLFGKVYVVVGENARKTPTFSEDERVLLINSAFNGLNVETVKFSDFSGAKEYGAFLKNSGAVYYVRGIRGEADLSYEKKAEKRNAAIYPFITTCYIVCEDEYKDVSSTKVKSLIKRGKDVTEFIPAAARETFKAVIEKKQGQI